MPTAMIGVILFILLSFHQNVLAKTTKYTRNLKSLQYLNYKESERFSFTAEIILTLFGRLVINPLEKAAHQECVRRGAFTFLSFDAEMLAFLPGGKGVYRLDLICAQPSGTAIFKTSSPPNKLEELKDFTTFNSSVCKTMQPYRGGEEKLFFDLNEEEKIAIPSGLRVAFPGYLNANTETMVRNKADQICKARNYDKYIFCGLKESADLQDKTLWPPVQYDLGKNYWQFLRNEMSIRDFPILGQIFQFLDYSIKYKQRKHLNIEMAQVREQLKWNNFVIQAVVQGKENVRIPHLIFTSVLCSRSKLSDEDPKRSTNRDKTVDSQEREYEGVRDVDRAVPAR